jgi:hypothetical protein
MKSEVTGTATSIRLGNTPYNDVELTENVATLHFVFHSEWEIYCGHIRVQIRTDP